MFSSLTVGGKFGLLRDGGVSLSWAELTQKLPVYILFSVSTFILICVFHKRIFPNPKFVKCPSCKKSFYEEETKNLQCPNCNIRVEYLDKYYSNTDSTDKNGV